MLATIYEETEKGKEGKNEWRVEEGEFKEFKIETYRFMSGSIAPYDWVRLKHKEGKLPDLYFMLKHGVGRVSGAPFDQVASPITSLDSQRRTLQSHGYAIEDMEGLAGAINALLEK